MGMGALGTVGMGVPNVVLMDEIIPMVADV